jgi:hypothetical protein
LLRWLADIQTTQSIAHGLTILSPVAALGLALGSVRVRGFTFGIAGTLFAGLILATRPTPVAVLPGAPPDSPGL